jgi:hypothetical protein
MAEEQTKAKKVKGGRIPAGVRAFERPRVTFMRLGRPVGLFSGTLATVNIEEGTLEFTNSETTVAEAVLRADKLRLSIRPNRLFAEGRVSLEEGGVTLQAERLAATPVLTGLSMAGSVHLRSDSKEAAEALLKFHKS